MTASICPLELREGLGGWSFSYKQEMETLLWLGGPPAAPHVLTTSWQQSGERRWTEPQRTGDQALSAVRRSLAIFEDVVPEDTGGRKVD